MTDYHRPDSVRIRDLWMEIINENMILGAVVLAGLFTASMVIAPFWMVLALLSILMFLGGANSRMKLNRIRSGARYVIVASMSADQVVERLVLAGLIPAMTAGPELTTVLHDQTGQTVIVVPQNQPGWTEIGGRSGSAMKVIAQTLRTDRRGAPVN